MKRLLIYLKEYRKESILAPLFKMLEASFELFVPLVMAKIIDVGIANHDIGYVLRMCLVMIGLGVIGLVCSVTAQYFSAKAAVGFATGVRHALFHHIQSLSYTEIDNLGTSTMITRMTSDVNQVQSGVNLTLRLFLRSPFIVFGAMIMAFTINVKASLIFILMIPLLAVIVFGIMLITMPLYKNVQSGLDKVLSATRENLTGMRVLRAFNKEEEERESFRRKNEALTGMQMLAGRVSALMNPLTYVVVNASVVVLIWRGALQVDQGIITQGEVVALVNYMTQILVELIKLANLIVSITKALACANRISSVLDTKASMEFAEAKAAESSKGDVLFDHVSITYDGAGDSSLSDISFHARGGQTIGVIGGTGCGKSTLVNLISRFYDATEGAVFVDGVNVKEYPKDQLRDKIGVVPQKAVLFKGTIRENMCWGKEDATDEEIWEALEISQAKEFVEKKEDGLDEMIAQSGKNLSGGQRQRLTIARALVKKPEILILDDSASALDFATDAKLRRAISDMAEKLTVFIVSQRASSIRYADQILVLDDGELSGIGTHDSLLASCPVYQEIYYSQFPEEAAKHE